MMCGTMMDEAYIKEVKLSRTVMREFHDFLHHEGNYILIKKWHPNLFKAYEDLTDYYGIEIEDGIQ